MAWLMVFFDLPTNTANERRRASKFREGLKTDGFMMIQYSVYARPCPSYDRTKTHLRRVKKMLPPDGHVRILKLTDAQWDRMKVFYEKEEEEPEERFDQTLLFDKESG